MSKTIVKFLGVLLLSVSVTGCSDDDINYTVTITDIQKNKDSHYCVYRITSVGEPALPEDFFLDACDKYTVGETITISR